jgi:D-3-phosphoglycerate dehydrogenase
MMTHMSADSRPIALVTAPFRGDGLETLRGLTDVVLDPWISGDSMRMYDAGQLADRARAERATVIICETCLL